MHQPTLLAVAMAATFVVAGCGASEGDKRAKAIGATACIES